MDGDTKRNFSFEASVSAQATGLQKEGQLMAIHRVMICVRLCLKRILTSLVNHL